MRRTGTAGLQSAPPLCEVLYVGVCVVWVRSFISGFFADLRLGLHADGQMVTNNLMQALSELPSLSVLQHLSGL